MERLAFAEENRNDSPRPPARLEAAQSFSRHGFLKRKNCLAGSNRSGILRQFRSYGSLPCRYLWNFETQAAVRPKGLLHFSFDLGCVRGCDPQALPGAEQGFIHRLPYGEGTCGREWLLVVSRLPTLILSEKGR